MNEVIGTDGTIVAEYSSGTLRQFSLDNGQEFEAFFPNNYTATTPVMIYEHGNGEDLTYAYHRDWKTFTEKFNREECNSIIIHGYRKNSVDLYDHLIEKCNLQPENTFTVSFSGGTIHSLTEANELINRYPNNEPPISVILDGYIPTEYLRNTKIQKNLADNNAILLAFGQVGGQSTYLRQCRELSEAGVKLVLFQDQSEYGYSHRGINDSFTENGVLEYVIGEKKLPDNYIVKIYENGKWVSIDYGSVKDVDDVYDLFGIDTLKTRIEKLANVSNYAITSDNLSLSFYLNNIVRNVRNTNFFGISFENFNGSSTTSVPADIESLVKKHFNNAAKVMDKIVRLTDSVNEIHVRYEDLDNRLAKSINDDTI